MLGGLQAEAEQKLPLQLLGILHEEGSRIVGAHGAGELAFQPARLLMDALDALAQSRDVLRHREPEGDRHRVLTVGTADLRCFRFVADLADELVLQIEKHGEDHLQNGVPVAQRRGGVEDVDGRRAEVNERPHLGGKVPFQNVHERADIVLRACLFLVHLIGGDLGSRRIEPCLPNRLGPERGNMLKQRFQKRQLDPQAVAERPLFAQNRAQTGEKRRIRKGIAVIEGRDVLEYAARLHRMSGSSLRALIELLRLLDLVTDE